MIPVRYPPGGSQNKQERIYGALDWRFRTNRIKLPGHLRNSKYWSMLFRQVGEFQVEAKDGNLQFDDVIDTLAMHPYVKRGRSGNITQEPRVAATAIERLAQGETHDRTTGLSLLSGVNANEIPQEVVQKMITRAIEDERARRQRRPSLAINLAERAATW